MANLKYILSQLWVNYLKFMDKLAIGGVAEHFNTPWHLGIEGGNFRSEGIDLQWKTYHGGTGAMTEAMKSGELDVCIALTEGMISAMLKGNPSRIISTYVVSPLIWGVHTGADSALRYYADIFDKKYAISRFGSGSHLMPIVDASHRGLKINHEQFVKVGNLDGALESLAENESQVFYWEKYTTHPYVKKGLLRSLGDYVAPWPSFVIAATEDTLRHKERALSRMLKTIYFLNRHLMHAKNATDLVGQYYKNDPDQLEQWFYSTEWATHDELSEKLLDNVVHTLVKAGIQEGGRAYKLSDLCYRVGH